jgi:hypothetical protein
VVRSETFDFDKGWHSCATQLSCHEKQKFERIPTLEIMEMYTCNGWVMPCMNTMDVIKSISTKLVYLLSVFPNKRKLVNMHIPT